MGKLSLALNRFHWGQFFLSKIQWVMNLAILLKVFDMPLWTYIVFPSILILFTWLLGVYVDTAGIRLQFLKENFKGTNIIEGKIK